MGVMVGTTVVSILFPSIGHLCEKRALGEDLSIGDRAGAVLRDAGGMLDPTGMIVPSTKDKEEEADKKDKGFMEAEKMNRFMDGARGG